MTGFLDLTTCAKLLVDFGLIVVCLAVVSIIASMSITPIQASQRQLYQPECATAAELQELRTNQNSTRTALLMLATLPKQSRRTRPARSRPSVRRRTYTNLGRCWNCWWSSTRENTRDPHE
jgi:hypothetical protein